MTADRTPMTTDPLPPSDRAHLDQVRSALERTEERLRTRLAAVLAGRGAGEQGRLERDREVEHLRTRLRSLRSVAEDLVLGRMDPADPGPPRYVGRAGVQDEDGAPLLLDWRSDAARPFFAATRAEPLGLVSRRRYRWRAGRVDACWDELLDPAATPPADLRPDEESALLAGLEEARGPRMRDVLTTLAADQDAIIRADPRRPLVVDGGPGTGKTVVALHRAAYLLHQDPHLRSGRGGILVVGPSRPYLAYVADVLPNLGEDVRTCTPEDLVPEGAHARPEIDPRVAALKAGALLAAALEAAVAEHEVPPTAELEVATAAGELMIGADDWRDAFAAVDPGTAHDHARDRILEELAEILAERLAEGRRWDREDEDWSEGPAAEELLTDLRADEELRRTLARAWPLLDPEALLRTLFTDPALLRRCAPELSDEDVALLRRPATSAWTREDLPLLDAARRRVGDPDREARAARRARTFAEESARMDEVVDELVADDPTELRQMSMLRGEDLRGALDAQVVLEAAPADPFEGPFAHLVIDEAQELTDAQWRMLLARCPSHRVTVVGDRAQAAAGFEESWEERLARVGLPRVSVERLHLNYRTPAEIMERAEPVIRAAVPDANVPASVRRSGRDVQEASVAELEEVLRAWLAAHAAGTACVISAGPAALPAVAGDRVRQLTPALAKGLEFDLVVLVDPGSFGEGVAGAVSRYVAMTRATSELVVLRP